MNAVYTMAFFAIINFIVVFFVIKESKKAFPLLGITISIALLFLISDVTAIGFKCGMPGSEITNFLNSPYHLQGKSYSLNDCQNNAIFALFGGILSTIFTIMMSLVVLRHSSNRYH